LHDGGRELKKSKMDLVYASSFFIDYAFENLTDKQKRRQKQKEKCERAREQVLLEEDLKKEAQEERMEGDRKEFETMCKQIVRFVETKGKLKEFNFEMYLRMVERLRAPFKMEIDGHSVTVSAADTTIMLKHTAIATIKKQIIGEKRRGTNNQMIGANKRARTGGKPTSQQRMVPKANSLAHLNRKTYPLDQSSTKEEQVCARCGIQKY
jgi:hypothetical protein